MSSLCCQWTEDRRSENWPMKSIQVTYGPIKLNSELNCRLLGRQSDVQKAFESCYQHHHRHSWLTNGYRYGHSYCRSFIYVSMYLLTFFQSVVVAHYIIWPAAILCSGRTRNIFYDMIWWWAAGRAQDRESSPDRRSTTVPRDQLKMVPSCP